MSSRSALRTKPALWKRIVAEVTAGSKGGRPGQWSARKAQLAVHRYKREGGGYRGEKRADLGLVRWTKQRWRTKSGRPSLESGERYLPEDAIRALSPQQYGATTRAKREATERGEQFSRQPPKIAKRVKRYRRNVSSHTIAKVLLVAGLFEVLRRIPVALLG